MIFSFYMEMMGSKGSALIFLLFTSLFLTTSFAGGETRHYSNLATQVRSKGKRICCDPTGSQGPAIPMSTLHLLDCTNLKKREFLCTNLKIYKRLTLESQGPCDPVGSQQIYFHEKGEITKWMKQDEKALKMHRRILRVHTKDYENYDSPPSFSKPSFKMIPN